ncbi:hypothetical protein DSO57_1035619 [Entomophthora muscae]|uniref:Uncharacterized protein n=1 Tax=Entomophthora muscae TaxID=34485 RepID=A0ACC2SCG8_9FUNG|nr:hypothetical protein DSO57_1035619 [Entomophthora muscae]
MKEIPVVPPLPNAPPVQDFSCAPYWELGPLLLPSTIWSVLRLLCTWPSRPGLPPLWESSRILVWAVTHARCGETHHQLVALILIIVEYFLIVRDPDCLSNEEVILDAQDTN